MRRGDDIELEVETGDFLQFLGHHHGERVQDVGVVLHRLFPQQTLVGLVVEKLFDGEVLAEGVVAEEDVVAGHIGGHRVGPVEHAHLHKHQLLAVADFHAVAGLYHMEVPAALAILTLQTFHAVGGAVDRGLGNLVHQCGE